MRACLASLLLAISFMPQIATAADVQPYTTAKELDLTRFLPPPPANDSAQTKLEIEEILSIQAKRTPAMEDSAKADAEENIWRYSNVFSGNAKFNAAALPKFAAFFDRVVETEGAVVDPAKAIWSRPRPHMLSANIKPCVKISKSGAWPSGHATVGYLMATVLAEMVPEKRAEIFARAAQYAENRVIGGIHYRSDIVMGRTSGALIAQKIMSSDDFKAEFTPAKNELRAALGL